MDAQGKTFYCRCGCRRYSMMDLTADGRRCPQHNKPYMTQSAYFAELLREV